MGSTVGAGVTPTATNETAAPLPAEYCADPAVPVGAPYVEVPLGAP